MLRLQLEAGSKIIWIDDYSLIKIKTLCVVKKKTKTKQNSRMPQLIFMYAWGLKNILKLSLFSSF